MPGDSPAGEGAPAPASRPSPRSQTGFDGDGEGWVGASPKAGAGFPRRNQKPGAGAQGTIGARGEAKLVKEELKGADVGVLLAAFPAPPLPAVRSPLQASSSGSSQEPLPLDLSGASDCASAASSESSTDSVWQPRGGDAAEGIDLFTCPSPHRSPGIPLGARQVKNVVCRVVASSAKGRHAQSAGADADADAYEELLDESDYMGSLMNSEAAPMHSPPAMLLNPLEHAARLSIGNSSTSMVNSEGCVAVEVPDTWCGPARVLTHVRVQVALLLGAAACAVASVAASVGASGTAFVVSLCVYGVLLAVSAGVTYAALGSQPAAAASGTEALMHSHPFVRADFLSRFLKVDLQQLEVHSGMRRIVPVAVMFTSIKDFSTVISKMSAEAAYRWLLAFNEVMAPIIRRHGGTLEAYLGDGMTVLNECSSKALSTATSMQVEMDAFLSGGGGEALPEACSVGIRIGLHHGPVCAGLIGDGVALATTIISNVVNLAARFERLTKYYGARVLLSAAMAKDVPEMDAVAHRSLGKICVKGSSEAYELIDVYETDPPEAQVVKRATKADYAAACLLFAGKHFASAARRLRSALPTLGESPNTTNERLAGNPAYRAILTKMYFCKKYHTEGVPYANWHGEDVWDQK